VFVARGFLPRSDLAKFKEVVRIWLPRFDLGEKEADVLSRGFIKV
jgi:hypothetical protein